MYCPDNFHPILLGGRTMNRNGSGNGNDNLPKVGDKVRVMCPRHIHPFVVEVTEIIPVSHKDLGWTRYVAAFINENWHRLYFNNVGDSRTDLHRNDGICRHVGKNRYDVKPGATEDTPGGTYLEIKYSNGNTEVVSSWLVMETTERTEETRPPQKAEMDEVSVKADKDHDIEPLKPNVVETPAEDEPRKKKGANRRKAEEKARQRHQHQKEPVCAAA